MTDLEFIQRCTSGDKAPWEQFLKQYSRLIYNYIYSVLAVRGCNLPQNHIEDIFQDILYMLIDQDYKRLKSFKARNGCSFASWLRQVVVNFTLRYLAKMKPEIPLEEDDDFIDEASGGIEEIVGKEKLEMLQDCIGALNTKDKFILEFNIYRGIRLEALKDTLKATRSAVDMQKLRMLERLRECFKSKGFTEV